MKPANLFEPVPEHSGEEFTEILASGKGDLNIERIVSRGHQSPPEFWYDQETVEWVLLVKGSATLEFDEEKEPVDLKPGDWIEIPAHQRHRVAKTAPDEDTVWLAVHWK